MRIKKAREPRLNNGFVRRYMKEALKGDGEAREMLYSLANKTSASRAEARLAVAYVKLEELREDVSRGVHSRDIRSLLKGALGKSVTAQEDAMAIELMSRQHDPEGEANLAAGYLRALKEWNKRVK